MDPNTASTLNNAKSAGIAYRDVYFFPCSFGKSIQSQVDQFYNGLAMQLEALEKGEQIELVSDGGDDVRGLQAGYYPGWENDIDLSVYANEQVKSEPRETPEWRKQAVGKSYGMVWVDVETNPSSGCGWSRTHAEHCTFVHDLV